MPDSFNLDRERLAAAGRLQSEDFEEFQRLAKTLVHGPAFQLVFVDCRDQLYRDRVIDALDEALQSASLHASRLVLDRDVADVATFEERLRHLAATSGLVHVLGGAYWFDRARWDDLNQRRERLGQEARARLVFWLEAESIAQLPRYALDLWAWRSGVYELDRGHREVGIPSGSTWVPSPSIDIDTRSMAERHRRIAELRRTLASDPAPSRDLQVALLDEIGRLLFGLGEYDKALQHWQSTELPLHQAAHDERAAATTWGQIADLLQDRGELDEALRIRREEQLPIYERLGDVRSRALTMSKVADLLQAQGQLDEALRIRRDVLPIFKDLGDVRSQAMTMGKMAEVFRARGQLDEAVRIMREEELPVYGKLGDVRSRLVTSTKLAAVLSQRQGHGDLAEARQLLIAALADAKRLDLSEAEPIAMLLDKLPPS